MILALILGAAIGFATNVPVGPINAAVVMHGIRERFSSGMAFGVGAAFMDALYCTAAMFGISVLIDNPVFSVVLEIAAFALLVILGIKSLRTKKTLDDFEHAETRAEQRLTKKFGLHGPFLLGILLYLANPTFLAYWLGVSGILQRHGLLVPSTINNVSFALGVGAGSALWFYLILVFLLKRKVALTPKIINRIYKFSGISLLGFGTYVGYRLVVFTNWTPLFNFVSSIF